MPARNWKSSNVFHILSSAGIRGSDLLICATTIGLSAPSSITRRLVGEILEMRDKELPVLSEIGQNLALPLDV